MRSDDLLRDLEARVEQLVGLSARLREENHALRQREQWLLDERTALLKQNDLAKSKIEAIISRLKSLEQDS